MRIDLHCHSRYSQDNHSEPEDVIQRAVELGLDGVCFTEHHSVDASEPVLRIARPSDFLVLRGVEISTNCGHLLAYGLEDDSWNVWGRTMRLDLAAVIDAVHDQGGICVPAHPFRGWESLGDRVYRTPGLDGIETHNGTNGIERNAPAVKAAQALGLPSLGGSDCHMIARVGVAFTEFHRPIETMTDVVEAVREGLCRGLMSAPE